MGYFKSKVHKWGREVRYFYTFKVELKKVGIFIMLKFIIIITLITSHCLKIDWFSFFFIYKIENLSALFSHINLKLYLWLIKYVDINMKILSLLIPYLDLDNIIGKLEINLI